MSRRHVIVANATRPADEQVRGANLNEVRVEIRLIFGSQVTKNEVLGTLVDARANAHSMLWQHYAKQPHPYVSRAHLTTMCDVCNQPDGDARHT